MSIGRFCWAKVAN